MANSPEIPVAKAARPSLHRIIFLVFLLSYVAAFVTLAAGVSRVAALSCTALVLIAATATTLGALAQALPAQNVLAVAVVSLAVSSAFEILDSHIHLPFGRRAWTGESGPQMFHVLAWPAPLVWFVITVNSRGLARLVLGKWRNGRNYGLWSLALSLLLATVLYAAFDSFADRNGFRAIKASPATPLLDALGGGLVCVVTLICAMPWLIEKKPAPQPRDFHSLAMWVLLFTLLAACRQPPWN